MTVIGNEGRIVGDIYLEIVLEIVLGDVLQSFRPAYVDNGQVQILYLTELGTFHPFPIA